MASIRKRGAKWQAQVRRQGHNTISQSFTLKSDAVTWARQTEISLDQSRYTRAISSRDNQTLGDLFKKYRDLETPKKKGQTQERYRLDQLQRDPIATTKVSELRSGLFAHYRDRRSNRVGPQTVCRELTVIQRVLQVAMDEWNVPLQSNPVARIAKPKQSVIRDRRLEAGEFEALIEACRAGQTDWIEPLIRLAVTTAMRRGELLSLMWRDVNFKARTVNLPDSKNGYPRNIPLSPEATRVLTTWPPDGDKIFPVTPNAVRLAWERLRTRANIQDLRFHDLRHEAISRFFEVGLSVPEVALISGHRDYRMLFRYTHLRAESIVEKLSQKN